MLDLKELTKCHYDLLEKYQKLYDEHQVLQTLFDIKQKQWNKDNADLHNKG